MSDAIEAVGLVKRYGATTALAGMDLTVPPGAVCGLLGPNGAGKTTAVRILSTLLRPDRGWARVGGFDVQRQAEQVRGLIGLTGQFAAVDEALTGHENLLLVARLLELPRRQARQRAAELLERFGLAEAGGRLVKTYSGGMRRRLDVAASLVGTPAGVVPRRAHHRVGPQVARRRVGPGAGPGRRRHHGIADHPIPGRSRPTVAQHLRASTAAESWKPERLRS